MSAQDDQLTAAVTAVSEAIANAEAVIPKIVAAATAPLQTQVAELTSQVAALQAQIANPATDAAVASAITSLNGLASDIPNKIVDPTTPAPAPATPADPNTPAAAPASA